jgi:hypothetical protein
MPAEENTMTLEPISDGQTPTQPAVCQAERSSAGNCQADAQGASAKLYYLLRSRKFWAAVVAIVFIILAPTCGITGQELTAAVITLVAYILGTALEDGLAA